MKKKSSGRRGQIPTKNNTGLIRSFVSEMGLENDYEVWVPYTHRGFIGFVDLVVDRKKKTFLFEFLSKAKNMERAVKNTKLKAKIYREGETATKPVDSYLVLEDGEPNRRAIVQNEKMLKTQPFGILFFDGERTVSYSGTRERVPRVFQTKGVELETSALNYLIEKPNHEEIEEAILNLEGLPETISRDFVEKVERYIQVKGIPPEGTSSLELKRDREPKRRGKTSDVYVEEKPR